MNRNSLLCELESHIVLIAPGKLRKMQHSCSLNLFLAFQKLALCNTVLGTLYIGQISFDCK